MERDEDDASEDFDVSFCLRDETLLKLLHCGDLLLCLLRPTQMHQTFSSNKDIEFLIDFRMFDEIEFSICTASFIHFIFQNGGSSDTCSLNELMDSDDEKPQRGKQHNGLKEGTREVISIKSFKN